MKALILAAGRGSRMGDVTAKQPKCFTPLAGKRLIDWELTALKDGGVSEIGIVTGYCHEHLEKLQFATFHNARWSETNMVQSLRQASKWLETDEVIVSYSDIVYNSQIIRALKNNQKELCITFDLEWRQLWQERFENPLEDAETFKYDADFKILEIGGKTKNYDDIQGQFMGLIKFTPSSWSKIQSILAEIPQKDIDRLDTTKLLNLVLSRNCPLYGVPIRGRWCEVDSDVDRKLYENKIKLPWSHDWRD